MSAGGSNGEPLPTKSRGAGRQNSKKLLGPERCNGDAPHLYPQLLIFEFAAGLPATTPVADLKIPQYHRANSLFPCRTQLIHQQFTDLSSRLRSCSHCRCTRLPQDVGGSPAKKPQDRHNRSLGNLRRTSQIHPRDDRKLHQIACSRCSQATRFFGRRKAASGIRSFFHSHFAISEPTKFSALALAQASMRLSWYLVCNREQADEMVLYGDA